MRLARIAAPIRCGVSMGLVVAILLVTGCSESGESTSSPPTSVHEIGPAESELFGGLTVRLVFDDTTVESGDQLPNRLQAENRSGHPVTDPGCVVGQTASAIIPADDPEADLGPVNETDCGGPRDFPDGFSDEWDGPFLVAATTAGEPLPTGEYIAAVEIDGQRLEYSVEVVEQIGEPQPLIVP